MVQLETSAVTARIFNAASRQQVGRWRARGKLLKKHPDREGECWERSEKAARSSRRAVSSQATTLAPARKTPGLLSFLARKTTVQQQRSESVTLPARRAVSSE